MPEQFMDKTEQTPDLTDQELQEMLDMLCETDITVDELRAKLNDMEDQGGVPGEDQGLPGADQDLSDEEIQALLDDIGETDTTVEEVRARLEDNTEGGDEQAGTPEEIDAEQARLDSEQDAGREQKYDEMPTGETGGEPEEQSGTPEEIEAEQARLDSEEPPAGGEDEQQEESADTGEPTAAGEAGDQEGAGGEEEPQPDGDEAGADDSAEAAGESADDKAAPQPGGDGGEERISGDEPPLGDAGPDDSLNAGGPDGDGADASGDADQDVEDGGLPARAIAEGEEEQDDPTEEMVDEIMQFFQKHGDPTDEDIKALASHYDMKPVEMQELIYAVLAKLVSEGEDVPMAGKVDESTIGEPDPQQEADAQSQQANMQATQDESNGTEVAGPDQNTQAIPGAALPGANQQTIQGQPQQQPGQPQPGMPPGAAPNAIQGQTKPMPVTTPGALQDYYDPMISKPGETGSGFVDPSRDVEGKQDDTIEGKDDTSGPVTGMGEGEEGGGDKGERAQRAISTRQGKGKESAKDIVPGATTHLAGSSGEVQQFGEASSAGKPRKAVLLEQALKEAGYVQPIRVMFSKAADNILKAAGLALREVQITMPSGHLVMGHRWMKPDDARGTAPRMIGSPSNPVVADKVQRDLRASLSAHGYNPLMMMSVRDTDLGDAVKEVYMSKIHDGQTEKPRVVVRLRVNLDSAGSTQLSEDVAKNIMERLEETESEVSPGQTTTKGESKGTLLVSRHVWDRAGERIGYAKVRKSLGDLEKAQLPDTDWYHVVQGDGILAGSGQVVKTVLGPKMVPKGQEV